MALPKRKSNPLFPVLALVAGMALAGFELRRIGQGGEVWFWLGVAALLIALGTFAIVDAASKRRD